MNLRRFVTSLLATALVLGLIASVSSAHKAASASQLDLMIYHSSGRYYGDTPTAASAKVPKKCFTAVISTAAGGSDWGAYTYSSYALMPSHSALCETGNGFVITHLIHGRWYVIWEGSEGPPPTKPTKEGSGKYAFTLQPVPRAISKDLIAGLDSAGG